MNIHNYHETIRIVIFYGFIFIPLIDSVVIYFARRKKVFDEIGIIKKWLSFHYKYGIWKVNLAKIILLNLLAYPDLPKNPQFIALLIYTIHVFVFSYNLLFKYSLKGKNGITP